MMRAFLIVGLALVAAHFLAPLDVANIADQAIGEILAALVLVAFFAVWIIGLATR